jgi:hypothetical protein
VRKRTESAIEGSGLRDSVIWRECPFQEDSPELSSRTNAARHIFYTDIGEFQIGNRSWSLEPPLKRELRNNAS